MKTKNKLIDIDLGKSLKVTIDKDNKVKKEVNHTRLRGICGGGADYRICHHKHDHQRTIIR